MPQSTGQAAGTDWSEVYRRTYDDLVGFLNSKVWDPERARDLAQETFARALSHSPENPRAWLFTVAANLARDEARGAIRRKRHLELVRNEVAVDPVVPAEAPDRLEREERLRRVRGALDEMTDRDREVLLLWNAGHSYADIATQTGLSAGAIGTTLSRARRRLVEAYEELEAC